MCITPKLNRHMISKLKDNSVLQGKGGLLAILC
jgi:hypothetical protein